MAINTGMFPNTIVTNAGKKMIVQSQNGSTLTITRVALGDGVLGNNEDQQELTAIKSEKLSADISQFEDLGNGQFTLTFTIDNSTIEKGFWHREIGIMAKVDDADEQLYAYTNAGSAASFLYDKSTPIQARTVKIDIVIGSAENVNVTIDKSVVYTTNKDLEEHNSDADAHAALVEKLNRDTAALLEQNNLYHVETTGYGIVSGCEPSISGLTVTVGAGIVHLADGTRKEIVQTNITLDNADPTNPRIDLVYIDSTGTVAKVTGTAATSPSAPDVPSGGISVCNVTVAAGATMGIVIDSRSMLSRFYNTGIVNVKDFGAVGDGVTDDTAAFVAASKAGVNAIIPHGSYVVDNGVVFDNAVVDEGTYINLKPAYKNNDILINELGNCYKVGDVSYGTAFSGANQQGSTYNSKTNEILLVVGLNNFATQHILCVSPSDYTITRSFDYTTLGHAGTLEYDAKLDNIYVVTSNNTITIINATSMSIEGTLNIDGLTTGSLFAFKYDKVTGCWVALLHDGSVSVYINVYNTNFELIRQSVLNLPDSQTVNGCAVRNGNVLLATWTHFIQFDIFGNLKKYIYGLITRQEPEDFYYIGDNLYYVVNGSTTQIWQVRVYEKQGDIAYNPYNTMGFYGASRRNVDLNTITDAGCYAVYRTVSDSLNYPSNHANGILLVYCYPINGIRQIFLTNGALETTDKYIYSRMYHFGSSPGWSTWQRFATSDEVISSYRNGWASGGYVKLGSALGGFTIQYGVTQINGTADITFPISFTIGCVAVIPQITNGNTDFTQYAVTDTPSKTGATITANATGNRAVRWVAFGY